jgi:C-terminal processing protease CtpA/Prc
MHKIISFALLCGLFISTPAQSSITFQVDLKEPIRQNLFSETTGDIVVVRGSFEGWQSNEYKLNNNNNDSVYTGTFTINADLISEIEYKYCIIKTTGDIYWEWYPNPGNIPNGNRKLSLKGNHLITPVEKFDLNNSVLPNDNGKIVFNIGELKEDFLQLKRSLEEIHCALYEYTNREEFDSLFTIQFKKINKPREYNEFYNIVFPLLVKVGCMHTGIWMPGEFWNLGTNNFFPLQLKLIEGKAMVTGYYNDTAQVPIGSVIMQINSRPMDEVIKDVENSIVSDAMNRQFQKAGFEKRFPMVYASIYGFPEEYVITYAPPGSKTRITTKLITTDLESVRKVTFKNFNHPPLTSDLVEGKNIAIIKIPSFAFYDRVKYFTGFLDSSFMEIKNKNIDNLILDLRGNDGGDPFCPVPLLSYLEKKPVKYFAEEYGHYSEFAKPIPLAENNFTGNLYTLIDHHCGSTNGHFCALLKYHKIGKLVGSEGGATYKCNARVEEFRLKNTHLIVNVARRTYKAAVEGMDKTKGVEPDYTVEQSYEDFLNGKDTIMEFTQNLIFNKNNETINQGE